jgi:hypothetical protein
MTAPAIKPERKRLHRSDQTGVEQTKNRINPTPETRSHPQVMWQVPLLRHRGPNRLDLGIKQRQIAREGILLGECRLSQFMAFSELTAKAQTSLSPSPTKALRF